MILSSLNLPNSGDYLELKIIVSQEGFEMPQSQRILPF